MLKTNSPRFEAFSSISISKDSITSSDDILKILTLLDLLKVNSIMMIEVDRDNKYSRKLLNVLFTKSLLAKGEMPAGFSGVLEIIKVHQ